MLDDSRNDCCSFSSTFSPDHKLTVYIAIGLCVLAYFYSSIKMRPPAPVVNILVNCFLLLGFMLNIFVAIQVKEFIFWGIGNVSIGILILFQILENHRKSIESLKDFEWQRDSVAGRVLWNFTSMDLYLKIPILILLLIPVLVILSSILLIVGQKPDSFIRAFTDTYKHGFSQLDYQCNNVECGGHFLCSVAANGHRGVVKPFRYGERHKSRIICNRQLLIANAFEEIVAEHLPACHRVLRSQYNKVGNMIHRYYHFFNNKFLADCIYVLMKPLELLFLIVIYVADAKPENRIAKQYLSRNDRKIIDEWFVRNR